MNETIKRFWRIVYSNSHEEPFAEQKGQSSLEVQEKDCMWGATRVFWRFYWITEFIK
uniref:Uncharacterized protein n=1 Tax=viral metagenome TaxID=1070528 RepID=A0A6M3XUM6_9ZZZZ